jgi:DNA-binding Lrp family transcriptional regulator
MVKRRHVATFGVGPMTEIDLEAALRMAGGYALERLSAARFGSDLLDALILTGVEQANLEPLYRDPDLRMDFATNGASVPDEMRRPISVNALAQSMGLPFETVRRRIVGLVARGLLAANKQGVFVPAATAAEDRHGVAQLNAYEDLRGLFDRLGAAGWPSPGAAPSCAWTGEAPTQLAARISTDFTLRLIRSLTAIVGDPTAVAVWLAILSGDGSAGGPRPVRISQIARRLDLPSETARRRVQTLAARGLCEMTEAGAIITAKQFKTPAFVQLAQRNLNDLRRMFLQLADAGVIDAWRTADLRAAPRTIVALAA